MSLTQKLPEPMGIYFFSSDAVKKIDVSYFTERLSELNRDPNHFGHRSPSTLYACGFPLPTVLEIAPWPQSMQKVYIESLLLEVPLQAIIIHKTALDGRGRAEEYSDLIIHGQHELKAIESFLRDEFSIFDSVTYSTLTSDEKRRFQKCPMQIHVLDIRDMQKIDEITLRILMLSGESVGRALAPEEQELFQHVLSTPVADIDFLNIDKNIHKTSL